MDGLFGRTGGILAGGDLEARIQTARLVLVDTNLCQGDLRAIATLCAKHGKDIWLEPTSCTKSMRAIHSHLLPMARYLSPNTHELYALAAALHPQKAESMAEAAATVLRARTCDVQTLLVTHGAHGVHRYTGSSNGGGTHEEQINHTHFAAHALGAHGTVNTGGAGDCFAGCCAAEMARGVAEDRAIAKGMTVATSACLEEACVPARLMQGKL